VATKPAGQWVVPNPQVPRTLGILNIVFGALLILAGVYSLVMTIYGPQFQKAMFQGMEKVQATEKADRASKIAELKRKEAEAKTQEDKDSLKAEREELEKAGQPDVTVMMNDIANWNPLADLRVAIYTYSEIIAALVLNILMIISGIGLLSLSEWARKLAIWVAWLKIARWIVMTIVVLVLILPITVEKTQKMWDTIQAQAQPGSGGRPVAFPLGGMAQMTAVMGAVSQVFSLLFASIYPVVVIWFLTRPRTRAACLRKPAQPLAELELEPGGAG
jgi:hypothetical protein